MPRVPALSLLCERRSIPAEVAGATLLAAGCNAPELVASAISVFVTRSTVGAGTIVGSAPFNILCICGASALACGPAGCLLDVWLVGREAICLLCVLGAFAWVMADERIQWGEGLLLVGLYVGYVLLCVFWRPLLGKGDPGRHSDVGGHASNADGDGDDESSAHYILADDGSAATDPSSVPCV